MARTKSTSGRLGPFLFVIGSLQFIAAMAIVQYAYPCASSCYNILTNPISDLGNTVTSPLHYLFNCSLLLFAIMLFDGVMLLYMRFPKGRFRGAAAACLSIAAAGSAGVALVPENVDLQVHSISALAAFAFSALGILLIGWQLHSNSGKRKLNRYALYSIISGALSLIVLAYSIIIGGYSTLAVSGPGIGFGAAERVIAFPPILWILVTGLLLLKKKGKGVL